MPDNSANSTPSQITLDLEEAPVHVDTRRLQAHNESSNSLMINLTDEARKSLGWADGEQVIVKLYKDEDAIKLERYKSDRC